MRWCLLGAGIESLFELQKQTPLTMVFSRKGVPSILMSQSLSCFLIYSRCFSCSTTFSFFSVLMWTLPKMAFMLLSTTDGLLNLISCSILSRGFCDDTMENRLVLTMLMNYPCFFEDESCRKWRWQCSFKEMLMSQRQKVFTKGTTCSTKWLMSSLKIQAALDRSIYSYQYRSLSICRFPRRME